MEENAKVTTLILNKLDHIMESINKMTDDTFIGLQKEVSALKESRIRQDEALKTRTGIRLWATNELPKMLFWACVILGTLYEVKKAGVL